jgi:LPS export ABC transporter protein LptC
MNKHSLRTVAATCGAFVCIVSVSACSDDSARPVASTTLIELDADHMTIGMDHEMTQDGVRYAHLRADTAFYYADSTEWSMRHVDMTIFTTTGAEQATLTSLTGVLDEETEAMIARGDVVMIIPDRDGRLESSELHYDPLRKRFWSDSATVWREGSQTSRGTGFESDLDFKNVTVRGASTRGRRIRF